MLLTDFQIIRPPFETSQEDTLNWLVEAHAQSELHDPNFKTALKEKLWHVGCKPDRIAKRGHILEDFLHLEWEKMKIYDTPSGKDLSARMKIFQEHVDQIFEEYYPVDASYPDDLIHVTCTGYVSPSGAQKIASKRNWGPNITVTHAYHMGCYGSFPAIRMGTGFLNTSPAKNRIDIVHTEVCCLHSNPSLHQLDQLVSQSLFADGFMKYSILRETKKPHLKISQVREEIIPNSTKAMTWNVVQWGFQMSLAKEVVVLIARYLPQFLERLSSNWQNALFAIHPGGPKILTHIQELLNLKDEQMRFSFQILKEYGNMSSATIPHIWERILNDETVPDSTPIISLAFGPGLSICGAIMEKRTV